MFWNPMQDAIFTDTNDMSSSVNILFVVWIVKWYWREKISQCLEYQFKYVTVKTCCINLWGIYLILLTNKSQTERKLYLWLYLSQRSVINDWHETPKIDWTFFTPNYLSQDTNYRHLCIIEILSNNSYLSYVVWI